MSKIIIKNTKYADSRTADSRTADKDITKDKLYDATINHINDVRRGMDYFSEQIHKRGLNHDYTKIDCFDDVYAPSVLSGHTDDSFKQGEWYQRHITEERHHVNDNAQIDINLIDIFEHIVDIVMAGKGRAGQITSRYCDMDPILLHRAYYNTIRMLDEIVEVSNAEELLTEEEEE